MAGEAQAKPTVTTTNQNQQTDQSGTNWNDATTNQTGTQLGFTSGLTGQTQFGQQQVTAPEWLRPFLPQAAGVAGTALTDFQEGVGGFQVPQATLDALTKTAQGDFLYGGPGQQGFIDAAVRAAQPGVYSAFGAAGRGGSGLERANLDQTAVDAFARLYQGERQNQLSAAGQLPGLSMLPLQLQQQLATLAGGLPGQFAPFLGQTTAGGGTGFTSGLTGAQTSAQTNAQQQGGFTGTSSSSGTGRTEELKPVYEDPWWKAALGGGALLGSMLVPGAGGVSAMGNLLGGIR